MNRILLLTAFMLFAYARSFAFCGFYVAKAGAELFNESSQVIMVRDGDHTVITMSNDFKGESQDFAMVVPVPVVLKESDIRVVQQMVFDKLDAYTAPRMAEYHDPNPCRPNYAVRKFSTKSMSVADEMKDGSGLAEQELGVTIEASYTVGEYDILILSAQESGGLKTWLTQNGYTIPKNAEEVLQPYINDKMKFFVVKVNLEEQSKSGYTTLRPLQIQFNSNRFMLPIRLGMANSKSTQDLVVYALTRKGRVETANYRTTLIPTDRDIPTFVKTKNMFGEFYTSVFDRSWKQEGKNSVMLEYAWDISSQQPVKCDPCVTQPITFQELREAGVWWISPQGGWGGYQGDLFVTRLHARYSRDLFPQDLMFIATPNQTSFQGRYVIHNPATGPFDCEEGKKYLQTLKLRKKRELAELAALTGWSTYKYGWYLGDNSKATDPIDQTSPIDKEPGNKSPELIGQANPKEELSTPATNTEAEPEAGESIAAATTGDDDTVTLSMDEIEVSSEEFLSEAVTTASTPDNPNTLLFVVAMLVLGLGLVYRRHQRQTTA